MDKSSKHHDSPGIFWIRLDGSDYHPAHILIVVKTVQFEVCGFRPFDRETTSAQTVGYDDIMCPNANEWASGSSDGTLYRSVHRETVVRRFAHTRHCGSSISSIDCLPDPFVFW